MTRAIIYTRYSPRKKRKDSAGREQKCESCEIQGGICHGYARQQGYKVVKVFHDRDKSGKDEYRKKLWQAIEMLRRGDVLLVFKRDRLARNVYLAEQISRMVAKKGATIEAVSGDVEGNGPEQILARQILASVYEYERKNIGLRTSYAMLQHQKDGKRMGRYPPYGYRFLYPQNPEDPTTLTPVPSEMEAVNEMRRLREKGLGYSRIAEELNRTLPDACRGQKWHGKVVMKTLNRLQEDRVSVQENQS